MCKEDKLVKSPACRHCEEFATRQSRFFNNLRKTRLLRGVYPDNIGVRNDKKTAFSDLLRVHQRRFPPYVTGPVSSFVI
jgi:hypothetical protein